jgi:hypothetical protein
MFDTRGGSLRIDHWPVLLRGECSEANTVAEREHRIVERAVSSYIWLISIDPINRLNQQSH